MGRKTSSPPHSLTAVAAWYRSYRIGKRHVLGIVCMLAIGGLLAACSSSGGTGSRREGNVITREELIAVDLPSAYEAVQRLRPQWLRGRGATSIRNPEPMLPVVYISGVRQGGPESLRVVRITEVSEIRFISATDATTRWGTGHTGGAIDVVLR